MDFTDTQQEILVNAWLLAREGKGQVVEDWAEPDAQQLADAGWLERRTVDATGDTSRARGTQERRATSPDRELRVLAELRRPVVVGDLALEISECQPYGIRLGPGVMRHVGTGARLTGREHRRELRRTAGVRIRIRSQSWRNQPERQHHGGDCCRLSHCDSHCGFLSSLDLAATLCPHGWRSAGTAVSSKEVPRAPHRFVTRSQLSVQAGSSRGEGDAV
jgi:hypothetical protein